MMGSMVALFLFLLILVLMVVMMVPLLLLAMLELDRAQRLLVSLRGLVERSLGTPRMHQPLEPLPLLLKERHQVLIVELQVQRRAWRKLASDRRHQHRRAGHAARSRSFLAARYSARLPALILRRLRRDQRLHAARCALFFITSLHFYSFQNYLSV